VRERKREASEKEEKTKKRESIRDNKIKKSDSLLVILRSDSVGVLNRNTTRLRF